MTGSFLVSPRTARIAGQVTMTPLGEAPNIFDSMQKEREQLNNSMEPDILQQKIHIDIKNSMAGRFRKKSGILFDSNNGNKTPLLRDPKASILQNLVKLGK